MPVEKTARIVVGREFDGSKKPALRLPIQLL